MSDEEREKLRSLQDRWLAEPAVLNHVRNHGEDEPIATADSPTFRQVRECVLPAWEGWFREFLDEN